MQQFLPTGLPLYLSKLPDGKFKFEIAGERSGWSLTALDWLNYMAFNPRFQNGTTFFKMKTAITGEQTVRIGDNVYTVDGMVETSDQTYFLEFFGCRKKVNIVKFILKINIE